MSHDLKVRLSIVPLVFDARGLDVTPTLIEKYKGAVDQKSVDALEIIYRKEVEHVKAGKKWFQYIYDNENLEPKGTYHILVGKYFAEK